jgi:metallo-beta-lactamase family protein
MSAKRPSIQFAGAARTVTGSKFLLRADGQEVLFDSGLFQGRKELRQRNWEPLPHDPSQIESVVLTHGHIDHVGYLPRLVKQGFRGPVYCTPATEGLLHILLPDSARLQEEEAEYANRKGYSRHKPALPLYTEADAQRALERVKTVDYRIPFEPARGIVCEFEPSGHIIGAAYVRATALGVTVVFSGDVGGYDSEMMRPPAPLDRPFDYIVVESTYGGRIEEERPIADQLAEQLAPVLAAGGVCVIPAFAVGRTTAVLYHLRKLMDASRLPQVPVVVDSPMATDAVELYCEFANEHNMRVDELRDARLCPIRTSQIGLFKTRDASIKLNSMRGPAIIIAGSGMATGGRVLHHLKHRITDPKNLVLLVGYQAEGSRGRRLIEGAQEIPLFGRQVPVLAKVASIRGLSAHGDSAEILRWLKTAVAPPKRAFLVHGEEPAVAAMGREIERELGWSQVAPNYMETIGLE